MKGGPADNCADLFHNTLRGGLFAPQLANFAGQANTRNCNDRQGGQDKQFHYAHSFLCLLPNLESVIEHKVAQSFAF